MIALPTVLALANALGYAHPPDVVVEAIAAQSATDEDAALMVVYAHRESAFRPGAVGDGGKSCGVWQEPCSLVSRLTVDQQARCWLRWVHDGGLAAVDSSPARAARRQLAATALLAQVRAS